MPKVSKYLLFLENKRLINRYSAFSKCGFLAISACVKMCACNFILLRGQKGYIINRVGGAHYVLIQNIILKKDL